MRTLTSRVASMIVFLSSCHFDSLDTLKLEEQDTAIKNENIVQGCLDNLSSEFMDFEKKHYFVRSLGYIGELDYLDKIWVYYTPTSIPTLCIGREVDSPRVIHFTTKRHLVEYANSLK